MAPTAHELPAAVTVQGSEGPSKDSMGKDAQTFHLSLEYIRALTNVVDVQECLRQLELEETKVDADLDELLSEREELEASLDKLEVLEPQLGSLQDDSKSLVRIISDTSGLAETISAKVRQLDLEQSRVQMAIKHVEDVQELKFCISGVQRAMEQLDYENAAQHMHKALRFDKRILEGSFAEISVPSAQNPEYPTVILANAKAKLLDIISTEFENAVQRQSAEDITRYFKLFPLLGEEQAGLDKYSKFVCAIVSGKAQASLAVPPKSPTFYADTLIQLFESVAVIIDQHQPVVEKYYGPGKMLRVIQRLQEESDIRSRKILDAFEEERNISRKVAEIRTFKESKRSSNLQPAGPIRSLTPQPGTSSSQQTAAIPEVIDPRELDINLNEMVLISQRAHLYNRFLESRAKSEIEHLEKGQQVNDTIVDKPKEVCNESGLLRISGLSRKVEEIIDHYLAIEEFFLRRSVDKAMKINEYDIGSQTSSCVDDVFYILKKTISRAVYTSNVDCLAAMINFIKNALEMDYISVFQKNMATVFSNGDNKEARFQYMVLLNNVNVSIDYLEKLTVEIEQECVSTTASLSEHALAKAKAVLSGLTGSSNKFKQILTHGTEELFDRTLKPRLRPLLQDSYKDIKYVVTDEEYAEQEALNSFVHRFMSGLDALIEPFKSTLTEDNYNQMIANSVTSLTRTWEKIIFQTKFNRMGAIRFDKDLRAVGFYMTSLTSFPLREKLTRLNQMAMLLDLEELEDLYEIWGNNSGAITWRLTDAEVRRVLSSSTFDDNGLIEAQGSVKNAFADLKDQLECINAVEDDSEGQDDNRGQDIDDEQVEAGGFDETKQQDEIPIEKLRSSLRVSQKHIEKEIATLNKTVSDISKKSAKGELSPKEVEVALEEIVKRLSTLKRKLKDTRAEESLYSQRTKVRLQHLQDFTTINTLDSEDFARWSRIRLNRILIDSMLRDGFRKTAMLLAKSEHIEDLVDIELFAQSAKVEQALMRQSCTECLQWCKENGSNLKKLKSTLEFSLRVQEFIELARDRRSQEAISYAKKHLTSWQGTHMKEISHVMGLLAFPPETKCHPYKRLYDKSRWNDLIAQFRSNNFALQCFTPEPLLNVTLQAGLSALKTPMCYQPNNRNINCPVCDPETLGALAIDLPLSHHFNSSIVCRISGQIMNEDNLPMALPNGYVYSYNALTEMASLNNGKITCPRSGAVYDFSQLKKVFIS
ncbi:Golgi transport complex subunit 4 [Haplosporangium sp. Z 767]|nr:Golgi transport complex subunit 4 [Haplosporangium sp. Z 767]